MICSNCKHELNPLARVCPTCGTPVPGAPTVLVQPPPGSGLKAKKKYISAARVFVVIFCVLAVAMNAAFIALWFFPSIQVWSDTSSASVTLVSMHNLCQQAAPYLSYAVIALCVVSALFCILPLFRSFAGKRCIMIIPKVMTVLCAVCYIAPFCIGRMAKAIASATDQGIVSHKNPLTFLCVALFVLLYVIGGLTSRNRYLIQRHRIETLEDQLTAYGIRPLE